MKKTLAAALLVAASQFPASAIAQNSYNANVKVQIIDVVTYADDATLLFTVSPQPTVPNCSGAYFIVPSSAPKESQQMVLSRLLTAKAMGEKIYIGYDAQLCGPMGHIRAFRVG